MGFSLKMGIQWDPNYNFMGYNGMFIGISWHFTNKHACSHGISTAKMVIFHAATSKVIILFRFLRCKQHTGNI